MELFDHFDRVKYNGYDLTNILRRIKPIRGVLDKVGVYYDYIIKEGERADTIAFDYYGDSSFTWLIYICNNIYDPYYQWPLTHQQLFKYITRKYGDYYQTQVDVKWYKHPDKSFGVSYDTLMSWPEEQRIGWAPQTFFEYEYELNEQKRYIKLISNQYLDQITREIGEIL